LYSKINWTRRDVSIHVNACVTPESHGAQTHVQNHAVFFASDLDKTLKSRYQLSTQFDAQENFDKREVFNFKHILNYNRK